jgi:hypothetical protein
VNSFAEETFYEPWILKVEKAVNARVDCSCVAKLRLVSDQSRQIKH